MISPSLHGSPNRFLLVVFLMLLEVRLISQLIPSKPVTLIDHTMGLSSPFNFYIHKDTRGLVWICSISGLYQFDGKRLKVYKPDPEDLPNANPQHVHSDFFEDPKGDLWFGTWRGITCYIRKLDRFKSYLLENANPSRRFSACGFDSHGQLWFIHDNGIYTLDTATTRMERQADIMNKLSNVEMQLDETGHVKYIFCYNRYKEMPGLYVYEFDAYKFQKAFPLLTSSSPDSIAVTDVQVVTDTSFLIASSEGLFTCNLTKGALHPVRPNDFDGTWNVFSITSYKDSLFLLGTAQHGYYTFDAGRSAFLDHFNIHTKGEEIHEIPLSMYTDPDGAIWIHVKGRGVAYFHPDNHIFDYYPMRLKSGERNGVMQIQDLVEIDNHRLLASSQDYGVYNIQTEHGEVSHISKCTECPQNVQRIFKDSKGNLWMNKHWDLYRMDPNRKVIRVQSKEKINFGFGFCELQDGRIINVSNGKLYISEPIEENEISFSRLQALDTTCGYSHIALLSDGLFYASTSISGAGNGIFLRAFDPEDNFKLIHSHSISWGIRNYQPVEGTDNILIASTQGPYLYNSTTKDFSFLEYTGCNNETIWGILPLNDQSYLLCGEKCISVLDLGNKKSQSFGLEHGLGMEGVTWFGFLRHSGGKIWLGHNTGFSLADPNHLDIPAQNADVNITAIRVNERLYIPSGNGNDQVTNPTEIRSIRLPYGQNTVSFEFAALSYSGIDAHEYEYRMSGIEEEWVDGERQGYARYVNLPAGEFVFEVRVKNKPASAHSIGLSIKPPFYASKWFVALILMGLAFLVFQLTRWREQRRQKSNFRKYEQQLAIEKERLRISNNLHDDLGSGLSALNLKARVLAQQSQDPKAKSVLQQLADSTGKLVDQIRETIWTINAQNDTVDSLVTKLHQYTLEYFENTGIACSVHLMPEQIRTTIPGVHRTEIYLAYKEALHNIYKHSQANKVDIRMKMNEAFQLTISIQDYGTGFDPKAKNHGIGIQSMMNRMKEIGGEFSLTSHPQGTTILFTYPVPT